MRLTYSLSNRQFLLAFFSHKKHQRGASIHEIKKTFPLKSSLIMLEILKESMVCIKNFLIKKEFQEKGYPNFKSSLWRKPIDVISRDIHTECSKQFKWNLYLYRIVASTNTCYYSENQIFCFLKSRILTCRFF